MTYTRFEPVNTPDVYAEQIVEGTIPSIVIDFDIPFMSGRDDEGTFFLRVFDKEARPGYWVVWSIHFEKGHMTTDEAFRDKYKGLPLKMEQDKP